MMNAPFPQGSAAAVDPTRERAMLEQLLQLRRQQEQLVSLLLQQQEDDRGGDVARLPGNHGR